MNNVKTLLRPVVVHAKFSNTFLTVYDFLGNLGIPLNLTKIIYDQMYLVIVILSLQTFDINSFSQAIFIIVQSPCTFNNKIIRI